MKTAFTVVVAYSVRCSMDDSEVYLYWLAACLVFYMVSGNQWIKEVYSVN